MSLAAFARVGACALLAAALAACSSMSRYEASRQPRYQPVNGSDFLAQTGWVLVRWVHPGGARQAVPTSDARSQPITINFAHELGQARVTGFAGCNPYISTYSVANGNLILTATPAITAAPAAAPTACQPADRATVEQAYLAALIRIRSTATDNYGNPSVLSLTLDDGDILTFNRRPD